MRTAAVLLLSLILSSAAFAFDRCYEQAEAAAVKAHRSELPIFVVVIATMTNKTPSRQTYVVDFIPMHAAEDEMDNFPEMAYEVVFRTDREMCEFISARRM